MSASADVIVVLGAAPLPDGRPGPAMMRRVERGVELYREGRAPRLLMTGGPVRHAEPEADIMARLAFDHGVPDGHVLRECASANTFENAVYSARVMRDEGMETALLVTDPFHLPRALFIFRALGLRVEGIRVTRRAGEATWRWYAAYLREGPALVKSAALFLMGRHKPVIAAARRDR